MMYLWSFSLLLISLAFDALAAEVVIKSTANRGETNVGDYWIAEDFAQGFQTSGIDTQIDYRGEYQREHQPQPKINLFMRGYTKFYPPFEKGCNVLYVYYPMAYSEQSALKIKKDVLNARMKMPENASLDDDWQNYDVIAVASSSYAEELNKNGIEAVYVPQFTNPNKFHPDLYEELKTDILFVGSNWHERTSLLYALESGFEVAVYGYKWDGIVPPEMYKASYIPNDELNKYYSSAKIVLNDHRPDMKEFGFVNNRIYDATAAGALVISDYMPEIEAVYGDTVPMFKNKKELSELLNYYLNHDDERQKKAEAARQITLAHFTNAQAVQQILKVCHYE